MTNELRRVIEARLYTLVETYGITEVSYRLASEDAMYQHIVFDFATIVPREQGRQDYTVDVHIWAREQFAAFRIADAVAALFSYANSPQEDILPTFYRSSVFPVDDPDKSILHVVVRLDGQTYDKKEVFQWHV